MSKSINIGQPLFNNIEGHPFILGPQGPYLTKEEAKNALINFYETINDIPNGQECIIAGVRFVWKDNDLYENLSVKVINENNTDLNSYKTPGTYRFSSIRNNNYANLPISNNNPNASITGELVVYNSIEGTTTYRSIIGQVLFLSNAEGHETKIYTRSANKTSEDGGATYKITWGDWHVCQGMKEVGIVNSYDSFIDNGMYSGVYNNNGIIETFIVITINDYVVKSQLGASKSVSQLKYALNAFNNESKLSIRIGGGQEFKWGEWKLYFDEENIAIQITNLQNQLNFLAKDTNHKIKTLIINDLVTGGVDKALSAEMGKSVWEKLIELKEGTKEAINNINPTIINGEVTNAPDEEDLTSNDDNLLQFKDRNNLNGMGYRILRQNKTFEEQLTQTNTIYEIRYDFDLNNSEIVVPDNCVLKFEGGCLKNGKLELNNTYIKSSNPKIFRNIQVVGSSTSNIKASWWDIFGYNNEKQTEILKNILNINANRINIDIDFHLVNPNIEVANKENCILDFYGSHIYVDESDYTRSSSVTYRCLRLMTSNNVTIKGMRATGDVLAQCKNPSFPTKGNLLCHGIDVYDCQNITIDNCIIDEMIGDSVTLGGNSHNKDIHITNCKFSSNRRQGISILCGSDIYIYNCTIKDIGKDIPNDIQDWGCGIDIEPWRGSDYVKNVIIDSCYFGNTTGSNGSNIAVIGTAFSDATESVVSDINITNCFCQGDIFINTVLNTIIERCTLKCLMHRSGGVNDGDVYYATVRTSSLSRIYTDMKASYTIIEDCIIKTDKENKPNYTIWCQGKGVELYNTSILGHGKSSYVRILTTQTAIIDNCRFDDERYVSTTEDKTEEWIRIDTTNDIKIVNSNFDLFYAIVFNDTGSALMDNCTFTMKKWDDGITLKDYAVHFRTRYFNTEKSSADSILRNNRCKDCNYLYHFYSKTGSSYENNIFIANYILHDTANELVKPKPEGSTDGVYLKYQTAENSIRMTSQGIQIYKSWKWRYLDFTLSGIWTAKPTDPPIGTWYHCTDRESAQKDGKGQMIRYIGDGLWTDALGEIVNAYYPKPKYGTYSQAKGISKIVADGYTYNLPPGSTFFCTDKKSNENSEGTLLIWTGVKWVNTMGVEV